jgi:hypothetical protein
VQKLGLLILAIAIVAIPYSFGSAIIQGGYFGGCDHAAGEECRIVHVLGIVMHRDTPVTREKPATTPEIAPGALPDSEVRRLLEGMRERREHAAAERKAKREAREQVAREPQERAESEGR